MDPIKEAMIRAEDRGEKHHVTAREIIYSKIAEAGLNVEWAAEIMTALDKAGYVIIGTHQGPVRRAQPLPIDDD